MDEEEGFSFKRGVGVVFLKTRLLASLREGGVLSGSSISKLEDGGKLVGLSASLLLCLV